MLIIVLDVDTFPHCWPHYSISHSHHTVIRYEGRNVCQTELRERINWRLTLLIKQMLFALRDCESAPALHREPAAGATRRLRAASGHSPQPDAQVAAKRRAKPPMPPLRNKMVSTVTPKPMTMPASKAMAAVPPKKKPVLSVPSKHQSSEHWRRQCASRAEWAVADGAPCSSCCCCCCCCYRRRHRRVCIAGAGYAIVAAACGRARRYRAAVQTARCPAAGRVRAKQPDCFKEPRWLLALRLATSANLAIVQRASLYAGDRAWLKLWHIG